MVVDPRLSTRTVLDQSISYSSQSSGNRDTISETSTVDRDSGQVITDVNIVPFMREIDIDFFGYNLRPNREVFFYFDDKEVVNITQRPNIITLDTRKTFKDYKLAPRELLSIVGGQARIFHSETNSDGNTVLYIGQISQPKSNVTVGNTVLGIVTGSIGNVVSYQHSSGYVQANSNTTIVYLSKDADSQTNNVYVGNVISIMTGIVAGQTSNIISYNASTRQVTVSPAFTNNVTANAIYSIGDYRKPYSSNTNQTHYTTNKGFIVGTLHLPDPQANTFYSFRTGDRIFRILDNTRNDLTDYTTRADYRFTSTGLKLDVMQVIDRTVTTNNIIFSSATEYEPPPPPPPPPPQDGGGWINEMDPIAQSFYIDETIYREGIFVSSIDLFFKNKGETLPIEVQIRPMNNGLPDSKTVLPYASVILEPEDVRTSDLPNTANSLTATRFTFPSPVYLAPAAEYAFVIFTNDYGYDLFVSEVGETQLGTDRLVSKQPFLGSMFKSQAGTTYTPLQDEDVMFVLNKCVFTSSGSVVFNEIKDSNYRIPYRATDFATYNSNIAFDLFQVHSDAAQIPGTLLTYNYRATGNDDFALDSSYVTFKPEQNVLLDERKVLIGPNYTAANSFYMQVLMTTTNPDVSPVVFHNRQSVVPQQMLINNMPITNTIIAIANTGSGYTNANTTLTFNGLSGSGASGYIVANGTGHLQSVIMTSEGSGYYNNITCTITSTDGTGGSIVVSGETDKSGGPALARYITETVTLLDQYDGGDLRVYLTASRPRTSDIAVYYKVRNALDAESIDEKNWTRMTQTTGIYDYSDNQNAIEYEYRPSTTSNNIIYTSSSATYKTFNQFKVKVVLSSSSTLYDQIPRLYDIRSIAMPADAY